MNRRARDNRPYVRPVEKIEVTKKNINLKWAAAILFFVVGAATLAFALSSALSQETGWQTVEIDTSYVDSCANEFVLAYNIGAGEMSATKEYKTVKNLYADAAKQAYKLFSSTQGYGGINNIFHINSHPNEEVTVDPALYAALEQLERSGVRSQYLGPAYEIYNGLFKCAGDHETADFDPYRNESVSAYFAEVAVFANDPDAVQLELLGDNRVRLKVSEEYLHFAEETGAERFYDLYWMKNAFIADFLANRLTENGYTRGIISSYDGFTRNMDGSGEDTFSFQLFALTDGAVHPLAVLRYSGRASFVYMRTYPVKRQDLQSMYLFESGEVRHSYLDVADGLPRTSAGDLAAYSESAGCADILLSVLPVFVTDELSEDALISLAGEGTYSVFCRDKTIFHTHAEPGLADIHTAYTAKHLK